MQCIITENIPHREHKHIGQIGRQGYMMKLGEVQSDFSPLPPAFSVPYDTTSECAQVTFPYAEPHRLDMRGEVPA